MGIKLKEDISESLGRADDFIKFCTEHECNKLNYVRTTTREQIERELEKRKYRREKLLASFYSLN
jgi:hypothetical protein